MVLVLNPNASKSEIKKLEKKLEEMQQKKKGFDAKKYCGTIKLAKDPLEIQKEMRSEWN